MLDLDTQLKEFCNYKVDFNHDDFYTDDAFAVVYNVGSVG